MSIVTCYDGCCCCYVFCFLVYKLEFDESYGIYGRLIIYCADCDYNHFITMMCNDGPELEPMKLSLQKYVFQRKSMIDDEGIADIEKMRIHCKIRLQIYQFCYGEQFILDSIFKKYAIPDHCDEIIQELKV